MKDTVISDDLVLAPGARFEIERNATLTIKGDLVAPAAQIFFGEGRVDLHSSKVLASRPEWWGAVTDDPAADCLFALRASLVAHPVTLLGLGDYHISETLVIDRHNRRLWGIGRTIGARGSRLVKRGSEGAVLMVGSLAPPPNINAFLRGIDVRWIELARSVPPAITADRAPSTATGLAVRHVLDCMFEGLRAYEHSIGYSIQGGVRTYLRDCTVLRTLPGSGTGDDAFVGFDMDGREPAIATGANASLYLIDCNARTGNRPRLVISIGCRLSGAISDTSLTRFETTEVNLGILVEGLSGSRNVQGQTLTQVNVAVRGAVLDQCFERGLVLVDLSDDALIDISEPYVALSPGGRTAIFIERCGGNITIAGGQCIGFTTIDAAKECAGFELRQVTGVAIDGTKLKGFSRPVDANDVAGFDMILAVAGGSNSSPHPAINLIRARRGYVRPRIAGHSGSYTAGVAAPLSRSDDLLIEPVGIDPAVVSGVKIKR